MNKVEVCYSPTLYPHYMNEGNLVVVTDVFRATSAIVTALHHGAKAIVPVSTITAARNLKKQGMLAGGERGGSIVKGFEFGNSPFSYMNDDFKGREIALTTTNGTKAINIAAKKANQVVIGAFLNLQAIADYIIKQNNDVVILCAGWRGRVNMEDSLFGGALTDALLRSGKFESDCDSANAAKLIYRTARRDLLRFLGDCSHRQRLSHLNLERDVEYCLQIDTSPIVPVLKGDRIVSV